MSTHANIGILDSGGTVRAIYVHSDGDLVGKRLINHYATRRDAEAILRLGSLASLGNSLDPMPPDPEPVSIRDFIAANPDATDAQIEERNSGLYLRPYGEYTVAYGRDQGEDGNYVRTYTSAASWLAATGSSYYHYLWIAEIVAPRQGRLPGWYIAVRGFVKATFVPVGQLVTV